jgi:hypothetical protein
MNEALSLPSERQVWPASRVVADLPKLAELI